MGPRIKFSMCYSRISPNKFFLWILVIQLFFYFSSVSTNLINETEVQDLENHTIHNFDHALDKNLIFNQASNGGYMEAKQTNETILHDLKNQTTLDYEHVVNESSIVNQTTNEEHVEANHFNETKLQVLQNQTAMDFDHLVNESSIINETSNEKQKQMTYFVHDVITVRNLFSTYENSLGFDEIDTRKSKTNPSTNDLKNIMDDTILKNDTSGESSTPNSFGNHSGLREETASSNYDTVLMVILGFVLVTITIGAIIGNIFVIAAILLERNLQNFQYYLTISLAVADLFIGVVVMPFGIYNELNNGWTLSPELCDFWTSSDVLCCTASILNLVAIAFDRYWAVTNCAIPRSNKRIITMIVAVWSVSLAVAVAPQFGWKDSKHLSRVLIEHLCIPSLALGYQTLSFATTIYIPLPVILYLYWKIYQTARNSLRWKKEQRMVMSNLCKKDEGNDTKISNRKSFLSKATFTKKKEGGVKVDCEMLAVPTVSCDDPSSSSTVEIVNDDDNSRSTNDGSLPLSATANSTSDNHLEKTSSDQSTENSLSTKKEPTSNSATNFPILKKDKRSAKNNENCCQEIKKKNKTAIILAIITGAFIVCWLPYFVLNYLRTRRGLEVSPWIVSFLGWLSYFNSTINPIIYTMFSLEFRLAFRRMVSRMRCSRKRVISLQ